MVGLVSSLLNKFYDMKPRQIDFNKNANINLEATSLSFILAVLLVGCLYKPIDYSLSNSSDKIKFSFLNWFNQMQTRLSKIKNEIIGMYNQIKQGFILYE